MIRRRTKRRMKTIPKLSSVLSFWNHKLKLNKMMTITKMRRSRTTRITMRRPRRTTRRKTRTITKL